LSFATQSRKFGTKFPKNFETTVFLTADPPTPEATARQVTRMPRMESNCRSARPRRPKACPLVVWKFP